MRKPLLLLFLLFCCIKGFSATFVVTSNADSGPGTLRDALTQAAANGAAETDYINFNLPDISTTGRTIALLSDLPNLSSNLIIDGSTQPGNKFGISDAKIRLLAQTTDNNVNSLTCCFNIDTAKNVEIYGLMLENVNVSSSIYYGIEAIKCASVRGLIVGAPGKGNIFKCPSGISLRFGGDIDSLYNRDVKISSNIFGLTENNVSLNDSVGEEIYAERVVNLTIGGLTPTEGNKFQTVVDISDVSDASYNVHTGNTLIANNSFGLDYTGTQVTTNARIGSDLFLGCYYLDSAQVSNNVFAGFTDMGLDVDCYFKFTSNYFGTDVTGTKMLGTSGFDLVLGYCGGGGIIGGTNLGDANIFASSYQNANGIQDSGTVLNIGSPGVDVVGNVFKCNNTDRPYQLSLGDYINHFASIANRTVNTLSGTATPNSRVDLYYSLSCDHCEPEKMFQSVNADATGNWNYTGALSNLNIIAASTLNETTSEFSTLLFVTPPAGATITNVCGNNKGSITGISASNNNVTYAWYNEQGKLIDTTKDLFNVDTGKYYLIARDKYCSITSQIYEVGDATIKIDTSAMVIKPASCMQADGSITGIKAPGFVYFTWTNSKSDILSNSADLLNVGAGIYTLSVTNPNGSCAMTFGPYTIRNTTGPNIDQSHAKIQSTNCGQSTGSITNFVITGTAPLKYIWWNGKQQTVSTDSILTNQPAGTYKLEVTDGSQCGAVYTTDITIPETNGITIDETNAKVKSSSCGVGSGAVTGVEVTGATKYQWTDAGNNTVSTNIILSGVPAGTYTLTASNTTGCSKTSQAYTIQALPPTVYPIYPYTVNNTCPNSATGSVTVTIDSLVASLQWYNSQGKSVGFGNAIIDQPAGSYSLYLTDENGCPSFYKAYTIGSIFPLTIEAGTQDVTADQCNLKTGSVTGIQINGGIAPYSYSWADANGNVVSTTADLENEGAGIYTLTVSDASGCGPATSNYTLQNVDSNVPMPSVSNVQVCSSGSVLLSVNNPSATAVYNLYNSESSNQPIYQATGGKFRVTVTANTSYFITQLNGTCESSKAQINVSVGLSALNIANTFTPNGDGVNDYWQVNNIANYPQALVQIFTRYGQKIFESKGYSVPFDGTYKGQKLPSGVYYYIINLNSNCSLLSGSLTIIR